jgi:hypothetical protein
MHKATPVIFFRVMFIRQVKRSENLPTESNNRQQVIIANPLQQTNSNISLDPCGNVDIYVQVKLDVNL